MLVCSTQARRIRDLYQEIIAHHFKDVDSKIHIKIDPYYIESVAYEYNLPVILSAMKRILSTKKPNKTKLADFEEYFTPYFAHYCGKSKIRHMEWNDLSKELYHKLTTNFLNCDFPVHNLDSLITVVEYQNLTTDDIYSMIYSLGKQLPQDSDKRHIPYFIACLKAHLQRKMCAIPIKDTEGSGKQQVSKLQKLLAAKLMIKAEDCIKLDGEAEAEEAYRALLNRRSGNN